MMYVIRIFDKIEHSKVIDTFLIEGIDHAQALEDRYIKLGHLTHLAPDVYAYMAKYKTIRNDPTPTA